jgi:hypothetical protein
MLVDWRVLMTRRRSRVGIGFSTASARMGIAAAAVPDSHTAANAGGDLLLKR